MPFLGGENRGFSSRGKTKTKKQKKTKKNKKQKKQTQIR